jgi:hypothetical protein
MVKTPLCKIWFISLGTLFALLMFSPQVIAESQTLSNDLTEEQPSIRKWAVIDGFRSAKFGMTEKLVLQAITKDFKVPSNQVKQELDPVSKTKLLITRIPNLLKNGETADIVYILGFKSKKLIHINIDWGKGVTDNFDPVNVLSSGNLLLSHFLKKRYKRKGYLVNHEPTYDEEEIIFFRGRDKKNRTVLLRFKKPLPKQGEDFIKARKNVSLILSYILDVNKPDVFQR